MRWPLRRQIMLPMAAIMLLAVVAVGGLGAFLSASAAKARITAQIAGVTQANGGTLFLDEVADIPLATQAKLLRALEYGEVLPVGANEPVRCDFRVISATHRDLAQRVEEGTFRHDLYFRLSAFAIHLPSLRERPQDIADLAEYFTNVLTKPSATSRATIAPDARAELERRPWPGNVRELRNAIEHALIMARGRAIQLEHLPKLVVILPPDAAPGDSEAAVMSAVSRWAQQNLNNPNLQGQLYERLINLIEPPLFEVALDRHHGQFATAARALGIHRTTLRKRLPDRGPDDLSDTNS